MIVKCNQKDNLKSTKKLTFSYLKTAVFPIRNIYERIALIKQLMLGINTVPEYKFSKTLKAVALPVDTFLEKLRDEFNSQGINCKQTTEKTGELQTVGGGVTPSGNLGGGLAHSNIITNKWNPFNIICPAKKFGFIGDFKGSIKLAEMGKYSKNKRAISYELKDYEIAGNLDFSPHYFWIFVPLLIGTSIGVIISKGLLITGAISVALIFIFYSTIRELGNSEIDFTKTKIDNVFDNFRNYIAKHNEDLMK